MFKLAPDEFLRSQRETIEYVQHWNPYGIYIRENLISNWKAKIIRLHNCKRQYKGCKWFKWFLQNLLKSMKIETPLPWNSKHSSEWFTHFG